MLLFYIQQIVGEPTTQGDTLSKRAAEIALLVGFIAFCIWRFFAFTITLSIVAGLIMLTLAVYNMMTDGGLMERNDAGRRRERRLLFGGLGSLIFGIFLLATGRDEIGQIGGELIVIIIMLVIVAGLLGYPLGEKKKSS